MRLAVSIFTVVAHLVLADAVTKEIAAGTLGRSGEVVSVVPGLFNLAYVENRGCAWGLFQGHVWPLAVFGLAALALLVWKRRDVFYSGVDSPARYRWASAAERLIYAGVVGNLIDRVFRGYVIDMLDFHWGASHFPCFNLADSYICIAAAVLIVLSFTARPAPRKHGR